MLIPQYSIRWLLGLTTVCAVIFSIFAMALRGSFVAAGVSMAIIALVVVMLVHVVFFGLVWVFSVIFSRRSMNTAAPARPVDVEETPATPILLD